ncbi:MAG: DUF368 domain-containing protein [Clostridiaceae bacterium]|jgi:putative membrane protein|nr:DUF368 domain-containing protein [Clostridiaceae bacterium]
MKSLVNIIKGVVIGIATLVPGVSGGTMAIILGLYDDIIRSISSFFSDIKKNTVFIVTVGIGGAIGMFGFSWIMKYLLSNFKFPMIYFFMGVIFGGIPLLYEKANAGTKRKTDIIYFILGFVIILIMTFNVGTIVNLANSTGILQFLFLFLAGIIIAVALILPGISTSFMLLAIGLYDIFIDAVSNLKFAYLIPIGLGTFFGVLATTRVLENCMNNKPRPTYLLILGFVLGSVLQVFPGLPEGFYTLISIGNIADIVTPVVLLGVAEVLASIAALLLGFILIRFMSKRFAD